MSFQTLQSLSFKLLLKADLSYIKPYSVLLERFLNKDVARDALTTLTASVNISIQKERHDKLLQEKTSMGDKQDNGEDDSFVVPTGLIIIPQSHRILLLPILYRLLMSRVRVEGKTNVHAIRNAVSNLIALLPIQETIPFLTQLFYPLVFPFLSTSDDINHTSVVTHTLSLQYTQLTSLMAPLYQIPLLTNSVKSTETQINTCNQLSAVYSNFFDTSLCYETVLSLIPHLLSKMSAHSAGFDTLLRSSLTTENSLLNNTLLWSIDSTAQADFTNIKAVVTSADQELYKKQQIQLPTLLRKLIIGTAAPTLALQKLYPRLSPNGNYTQFVNVVNMLKIVTIPIKTSSAPKHTMAITEHVQHNPLLEMLPDTQVERLINIVETVISFVDKIRLEIKPILAPILAFTVYTLSLSMTRSAALMVQRQKHKDGNSHNFDEDEVDFDEDSEVEDNSDDTTDVDSDSDSDSDNSRTRRGKLDELKPKKETAVTDNTMGDEVDVLDNDEELLPIGIIVNTLAKYRQLKANTLNLVAILFELFHEDFGLDVEISSKLNSSSESLTLFGKDNYQIVQTSNTSHAIERVTDRSTTITINLKPRPHFATSKALLLLLLPSLSDIHNTSFSRRTPLINIVVTLCKHRSTQTLLALPQFASILPSFFAVLSSPFCDKNVSNAVLESVEHIVNTKNQLEEAATKAAKKDSTKQLRTLPKQSSMSDDDDESDDDSSSDDSDDDSYSTKRAVNDVDSDLSEDDVYVTKTNRSLNRALIKSKQLNTIESEDAKGLLLGLANNSTPKDETSENSPALKDVLDKMLINLVPILCIHLNDRLQIILGVKNHSNDDSSHAEVDTSTQNTVKKLPPIFEPTTFLNTASSKSLPTRELNLVVQFSGIITENHTSTVLSKILLTYLPRGNPNPPYSLDVAGGISDAAASLIEDQQYEDPKNRKKVNLANVAHGTTKRQMEAIVKDNQIMQVIFAIFNNILDNLTDVEFLINLQALFVSKILNLFDLRLRSKIATVLSRLKSRIELLSNNDDNIMTLSTPTIAFLTGLTSIQVTGALVEPDLTTRARCYQSILVNSTEQFEQIMSEPLQHRNRTDKSIFGCGLIKLNHFNQLDLQAICWGILHDCYSQHVPLREYSSDCIAALCSNLTYSVENLIMPSSQSQIIETIRRHAQYALTRRQFVITRKLFLEVLSHCGSNYPFVFPQFDRLNKLSVGNFFELITDIQSSRRQQVLKDLRHTIEQEYKTALTTDPILVTPTKSFVSTQQPVLTSNLTKPVVQFILPLLFNFIEESQQTDADEEDNSAQGGDGAIKRKAPSFMNKNIYGLDNALVDELIRTIASCCRLLSWNQYKCHVVKFLKQLHDARGRKLNKLYLRLVCAILDAFPFPLGKSASAMSIEKNMALLAAKNERAAMKRQDDADDERHPKKAKAIPSGATGGLTFSDIISNQHGNNSAFHAIRSDISTKLIPDIFDFCTESSMKRSAANSSTQQSAIRTVRTAVVMTVVKLIQRLTPDDFGHHFPKLIRIITEQLGRKDPQERQAARVVLTDVFNSVGSDFLFFLLMELKNSLTINHQPHVLATDVVGLLQQCSNLRSQGAQIAKSKRDDTFDSLYNPERIAHNVDYCVPAILQIMHDDYFGLIAQEKIAIGAASIHPEMKTTVNMLRCMNLLGRLVNFDKMITMITCTLWSELDVIKLNNRKNSDPIGVAHKVSLCCSNLVLGLKLNPTAKFDDVVQFSTTLLATATGIELDSRFFSSEANLNDDQFDDLIRDGDDDSDDDDNDELKKNTLKSIEELERDEKKKKSRQYHGQIFKNSDQNDTKLVSFVEKSSAGKRTTRNELYAWRDNKLLKKYQINMHQIGELVDQVDITRLTLKNIDFDSYHSQSAVLLLCTDLFRLACTDSVMMSLEKMTSQVQSSSVEVEVKKDDGDDDIDDSDDSDDEDDSVSTVSTVVASTKPKPLSRSQRFKRVLFLLDPLPQILLKAILNIRQRNREELSQIGIISGTTNTLAGGDDKNKKKLFQQQQARTGNVLISALRLALVLAKLPLDSWRSNLCQKANVLIDFTTTLLFKTPLPNFDPSAIADGSKSLSKQSSKSFIDGVNTSIHLLGTRLLRSLFSTYAASIQLQPRKLQVLLNVLHLDVLHDGCGEDALHLARILIEKGGQNEGKLAKMYHHPTLIEIAVKSSERMFTGSKPNVRKQAMMLFYTYLNTFDIPTGRMDRHLSTLLGQLENPNASTRRTVGEVFVKITSHFNIEVLSKHSQVTFLTLCASLYNETDKTTRQYLTESLSALFFRLKTISPKLIQPLLHMLFTWMAINDDGETDRESFNPTHLRMSLVVLPIILPHCLDSVAQFLPVIMSSIAKIAVGTYQRMMRESEERMDKIRNAYQQLRKLKEKRYAAKVRRRAAKGSVGLSTHKLADDDNVVLGDENAEEFEQDAQIDKELSELEYKLQHGDDNEQVSFGKKQIKNASVKLVNVEDHDDEVDGDDDNDEDNENDEDDADSDVEGDEYSNNNQPKRGLDVDVNENLEHYDDADQDSVNQPNNDENDEGDFTTEVNTNIVNMAVDLVCTEWYMCFSAMACFEAVWKLLPLPMMDFLNRYDCNTHKLLPVQLIQIKQHQLQNKNSKNQLSSVPVSLWSVVLQLTRHKHHWVRVAALNMINTHFELISTLCDQALKRNKGLVKGSGPLSEIAPLESLHKSTSLLLPLRLIPDLWTKYTIFSSIPQIFYTTQAIARLYNSVYLDEQFAASLNKAISFCLHLMVLFSDSPILTSGVLTSGHQPGQAKAQGGKNDIFATEQANAEMSLVTNSMFQTETPGKEKSDKTGKTGKTGSKNDKNDKNDKKNNKILEFPVASQSSSPQPSPQQNEPQENPAIHGQHASLLWIATNLSYLYRGTTSVTIKHSILAFFLDFVNIIPRPFLARNMAAIKPKPIQTQTQRKLLDDVAAVQVFEPNPLLLSILSPVYRLFERASRKTKDLKIQAVHIQGALQNKIGKTLTVDTLDYIRRSISSKRHTRKMGQLMRDNGNKVKKQKFGHSKKKSKQ
jgi:hypothetical protein